MGAEVLEGNTASIFRIEGTSTLRMKAKVSSETFVFFI
jgi:hypothetical protein